MPAQRRLAAWRTAALLLPLVLHAAGALQHQPGQSGQSCPACRRMREKMRTVSLEAIKESILRKLGMKQSPNVTGRHLPHIPQLDHLYAVQADQPFRPGPAFSEERDDYSATTEKVIAFAQAHPRLRHDQNEILYFKFSEKVQENRVMRAHLWLFLKGGAARDEPPVTITIYRIANPDNPHLKSTPEVTIKESRPINSGGRWISIELRKVVSEWFKFPRENLGLVVEATVHGRDTNSQHLIVTSIYQESSLTPFLEVHTADSRRHRTKRTIGLNCSENSTETRCCRYPLLVDFEEFNWSWVIAPKRYEAYYCSGECLSTTSMPASPHTHIMDITTPPIAAGTCCAPRKMSSISMLYFDPQKSNIIYGILPDMVVERCGCS